jgi:zinc D-Ala-D-Ala carboxypeptidase
MKLTENFYLAEFINSDTALRLGIKNNPSPTILGNLKVVAEGMEKIGGSTTSAHCLGYAVDFKCLKFGSPDAVVRKIKASGIKYDQLICEGGAIGWTHISFAPAMRQQTLNALFDNKGKATYREFV